MMKATYNQKRAICVNLEKNNAKYSKETMRWIQREMTFNQAKVVLRAMMSNRYAEGYGRLNQFRPDLFPLEK